MKSIIVFLVIVYILVAAWPNWYVLLGLVLLNNIIKDINNGRWHI